MDVVPATPAHWSVPPFSGELRDGFIYGRGALDMKGEGIAQLMALVALKRERRAAEPRHRVHRQRRRGAGEHGSARVRRQARRSAQGRRVPVHRGRQQHVYGNGKLQYYGVGVAEKRTFWQRLTVRGTPSHGSRPTKDNPVPRLVAALDRIARYETPLHVTPGVEKLLPRHQPQLLRASSASGSSDVRTALRRSARRAPGS